MLRFEDLEERKMYNGCILGVCCNYLKKDGLLYIGNTNELSDLSMKNLSLMTFEELERFTELEKAIAKELKGKWMARDRSRELWIYDYKPEKHQEVWVHVDEGENAYLLEPLEHLFQSVKWTDEEPTLIEDIINS